MEKIQKCNNCKKLISFAFLYVIMFNKLRLYNTKSFFLYTITTTILYLFNTTFKIILHIFRHYEKDE